MDRPIFSILVPMYNIEKYLEQCIESILAQIVEDFELLCVDDVSTDGTLKIAENFAKKDKRIKIIKHNVNQNVGSARNTALKQA